MATATLTQKYTEKNTTLPTSSIPEKMNLRIRILHAVDYPEIALTFRKKHREILEEFGVANEVSSVENKWWENFGSYMFIVEDIDTGEIGAGMRLDVIDATHSIPMEDSIKKFSPHFVDIVHKHNNVLAEGCAWWTTKKFSERKLPAHLLRAGIAVASKLRINTLVGFPHERTIKIMQDLGFSIVDYIDGLGERGSYNYPSQYISTIVELEDTLNLPSLTEEERDLVMWLRQHPIQTINEEVRGRITNLEYDLRIM